MNRQISYLISFIVGFIFMIMPDVMIPKIQYLLIPNFIDKFTILFRFITWLGFLSVIVFGLLSLFEGTKNVIKKWFLLVVSLMK